MEDTGREDPVDLSADEEMDFFLDAMISWLQQEETQDAEDARTG